MRLIGDGKKKLIVAFHFQLSNASAWKCDTCRKQGLEMTRRCGWLATAHEAPARVVWIRGPIATDECPKSLITPQSVGWLEEFFIFKRLQQQFPQDLNTRQIEAFLVLEEQLVLERDRGAE